MPAPAPAPAVTTAAEDIDRAEEALDLIVLRLHRKDDLCAARLREEIMPMVGAAADALIEARKKLP